MNNYDRKCKNTDHKKKTYYPHHPETITVYTSVCFLSAFFWLLKHTHTKYIYFMMNLIIKALHRLSKFHNFQNVFEGLVTFNCNFKLVENCKNRTKNSHISLMKNHQLLNILSYINIFNGYKIFPRFNNLYNIAILNI